MGEAVVVAVVMEAAGQRGRETGGRDREVDKRTAGVIA